MAEAAKSPKIVSETSNDTSLDDLYKQLEILKKDMAHLTDTIGSVGKAKAHEAANKARAQGEALKDASEAQLRELRATADRYGRDANEFVKEQPGTAIGIAAGVGFLLGFLVTGRR